MKSGGIRGKLAVLLYCAVSCTQGRMDAMRSKFKAATTWDMWGSAALSFRWNLVLAKREERRIFLEASVSKPSGSDALQHMLRSNLFARLPRCACRPPSRHWHPIMASVVIIWEGIVCEVEMWLKIGQVEVVTPKEGGCS